MSYKYDSLLVIANKYGAASGDAKAQLFETYDQLRDMTVSGAGGGSGSNLEMAGGFMYKLGSLLAPSSFMTSMSGNSTYSIPGTSYYNAGSLGSSTYGIETYSGFAANLDGSATGEAAPIMAGFGSSTGAASTIADIANATAYSAGTASGLSGWGRGALLNTASVISGFGGILSSLAPYMGEYGLGAVLVGKAASGLAGAVGAAIQNVAGRITNNADVVLSSKVRNIETVCKMLDTQGDVVKKMLKEQVDGDSKAIENM